MCFKPCPLRVNSWQVSIFFGATSCVMQSLREGFQTHFCRGFYQRWILAGARSSLKKSECRGATSETRTCSTHHNYDQLCKQDATASSATAKSLAGCSFSSCPISSSPLRSLCRMAPCSGRTSMVINNPSWLKVGSPISARQKPIGSMTSTGHKQWQPQVWLFSCFIFTILILEVADAQSVVGRGFPCAMPKRSNKVVFKVRIIPTTMLFRGIQWMPQATQKQGMQTVVGALRIAPTLFNEPSFFDNCQWVLHMRALRLPLSDLALGSLANCSAVDSNYNSNCEFVEGLVAWLLRLIQHRHWFWLHSDRCKAGARKKEVLRRIFTAVGCVHLSMLLWL